MRFKGVPPLVKHDYKVTTQFRDGIIDCYITLRDFTSHSSDDTHNGYCEIDYSFEKIYYVADSNYTTLQESQLTMEEIEDVEYEIIRVVRCYLDDYTLP